VLLTVRLFARLREIAGTAEMRIQVADAASARDVWDELSRRYPAMAPYTATVSCAVNAEYARMTSVLSDGDEVAFLPPVSGG
jgi:molybdopterin converting factor subunit 1